MMRAFSAAVSGLRTHQTYLDAVANDIANVNTLAYKSSRFSFKDAFNQTLKNSGGPGTVLGSVNPQQVGLGVEIGSVDNQMSQGPITATGNPFDMAIQGDGFFRVSKENDPAVMAVATGNFFTRAGNFTLSTATTPPPVPVSVTGAAIATNGTDIEFSVASAAGLAVDQTITIPSSSVFEDGSGNPVAGYTGTFVIVSVDVAGNKFTVTPSSVPATSPVTAPTAVAADAITEASGVLVTSDGYYLVGYGCDMSTTPISPNTAVTQTLAIPASARSINVDQNGLMSYISVSGQTKYVGFLAIAKFPNPQGMERVSANLWQPSQSSGDAVLAAPTQQGTGSITSRALEMSNVDISFEFAEMIKAQRGFQVNSRTITTADEMLNTLVQMKR